MTARPFPVTGGEGGAIACMAPALVDNADQSECYCTVGTCGAGMLDAGAALTAATAVPRPSSSGPVDVVEYYRLAVDHYFMTADPAEIALLDDPYRSVWRRTGYSFRAYLQPAANTSPVCRFYLPPAFGDSHYFSASPDECAEVRAKFPDFVFEAADAFHVALPDPASGTCPAGTTAVYRLWNQRADNNHRYVYDRTQRDLMVAKGYVAEGYGLDPVVMCAAP
jgi:hypothetical protein